MSFFQVCQYKFQQYSKTILLGHSKRRPKIGFQDRLWLNEGRKYCRMLQESILQYFRHSLSNHLSLRPLFCLFLSGCLRQVLLYRDDLGNSDMDFHLEKNCYIKLFVVICFNFFVIGYFACFLSADIFILIFFRQIFQKSCG